MPLNLLNYEQQTCEAVKQFWLSRRTAQEKQQQSGKADQGERASVTSGKNMDGFVSLIIDIIKANGLPDAKIHQRRALVTLPGYFRPTKQWDLLVIHKQ